jgi:hypothetical protein
MKAATILMMAGLVVGLAGCATTRQVSQVQTSGFLGDYSQLHRGRSGEADLVYINPSASWAKYKKVQLVPLEFWKSQDPNSPLGKLDATTRQRLVDLLHAAVADELKKDYQLVEQPGPDVLVIRGAVTEARPSQPMVNLVSSVNLPLKAVSFAEESLTGTGIGVGVVTIEVELLDGQPRQRLVAAVDRRSGTKALTSKLDGTWGDVRLSFDWFAQRLRTRLAEERHGAPDKTAL